MIDEPREPDAEVDRAARKPIQPACLADDAGQELLVSRTGRADTPPLERPELLVEETSFNLASADIHSAIEAAAHELTPTTSRDTFILRRAYSA